MVTLAGDKLGDGSARSPRAAPLVRLAYRELNLPTNGSMEQHMAAAVSWAHRGWGAWSRAGAASRIPRG